MNTINLEKASSLKASSFNQEVGGNKIKYRNKILTQNPNKTYTIQCFIKGELIGTTIGTTIPDSKRILKIYTFTH